MPYYVQIALFLCLAYFSIASGQGNKIKRCFTCRSRGDLGDCKDPFIHNASSVDNIRGIEVPPCASGWCAKIVEGSGSGNNFTHFLK
nr:uncharacterized protein LOC107454421 [Parasteatoda tepidariorum]